MYCEQRILPIFGGGVHATVFLFRKLKVKDATVFLFRKLKVLHMTGWQLEVSFSQSFLLQF